MSAEARADLAARQAELVAALTGHGDVPTGFDRVRVEAAAASLARKRRRSVARAWPGMAEALGERFAELFDAYAAQSPLPLQGGPLADGRAFAHWLTAAGQLPEAGKLEALAVDLRYVGHAAGLRLRRSPALEAALLDQPRRLVLGMRLPLIGERWLALPIGFNAVTAGRREEGK